MVRSFAISAAIIVLALSTMSCGSRRPASSTPVSDNPSGKRNTLGVAMSSEEAYSRVLQFLASRAILPTRNSPAEGTISASGPTADGDLIDCRTATKRSIWLDEVAFQLQIMVLPTGARSSEVTVGIRGEAKKYTRRRTMLVAHRTRFEQVSCVSTGRLESELAAFLR
jgi:hypothetical protein